MPRVAANGPHAPPVAVTPRPAAGGGRFWKKLSRRRQKRVVEKVEPAARSALVSSTEARGLDYSNKGSKAEEELDHHLTCSAASSWRNSSYLSSSSVASASSSSSASNTSIYNRSLKPTSRLQKLAWGCIKWAF